MKVRYEIKAPDKEVYEVIHDYKTRETDFVTPFPEIHGYGLMNLLQSERPFNVNDSINFGDLWYIIKAEIVKY